MGWNTGYTIMEATVIGAYDLGVLDKKLLGVLLKPYAGTDIDPGGKKGLTTKNGRMEVEEVVILVGGGEMPKKPKKPWSDANSEEWDEYEMAVSDAFDKIMRRYGWD